MMTFLLAAIAPLPPAMPEDLKRDLHCVAVLGVLNDPKLRREGAAYTAIVGAEIMDTTGATRESVREEILTEAAAVRARGKLKPAEIAQCVAMMRSRLADAI